MFWLGMLKWESLCKFPKVQNIRKFTPPLVPSIFSNASYTKSVPYTRGYPVRKQSLVLVWATNRKIILNKNWTLRHGSTLSRWVLVWRGNVPSMKRIKFRFNMYICIIFEKSSLRERRGRMLWYNTYCNFIFDVYFNRCL